MKKSIAFILIILATLTANAQDRSKWVNEMLEAKHQMLIEEVGLTPTQQEQFMPLYEAMEKEIYTTNRDARTLAASVEKKKAPTDSEYKQAAEALSRVKVREGEIEAKYFEKFSKILSKRQLFLLKQTENKFTRTMLRGRKH
jgi:Spy/CpxP family protein refolding chaperone